MRPPIDNERVSPQKHRIADYLRPKTVAMLLLGFSSGLPFYLVGNTFGYWLRDEHTSLTAIGFLSWVGIAYSLKFLWAPLMDRVDLPLFKRLGHRRGWMMFSQIVVGLALCAMGATGTKVGLGRLGACALIVAFASSTQDIVVDAWRIESADDGDEQGLLASAYQFSYRLALLTTDSLILIVAAAVGWRMSYGIYGACMAVGIIATWFAKEPERANAAVLHEKGREAPLWRRFFDAIVGPFIAFFRTHGWLALADVSGHQPLPVAGLHDGPDGESLLPRPRPYEANGRSGARLHRANRDVCRHRRGRILLAEAWLHARPCHRGYFAGCCDCRICDSRVRGLEHSSLRLHHGG